MFGDFGQDGLDEGVLVNDDEGLSVIGPLENVGVLVLLHGNHKLST